MESVSTSDTTPCFRFGNLMPLFPVWKLAVVAVGMRAVFTRPGYGIVWPDGPAAFPYMATMFVLVGVPAVLAVGLEAPWLWPIAGMLAGVMTLEMGRRYRKMFARV